MNPTANHRGTGLLRFCVLGVLVTGLPAQNDAELSAEKPAVKTPSPSPSQLTLATISGEACQVRCFASNLSPVYETTLAKGAPTQRWRPAPKGSQANDCRSSSRPGA